MRVSEKTIERRMLAVLLLVERCRSAAFPPAFPILAAGRPGGVPLSISNLSRRLGLTRAQTRCALRRLVDGGLLTASARHLPNGGQIENGYAITDAGRAFLYDRLARGGVDNVDEAVRGRVVLRRG